jgi:DNA invertase Pin-like site-specific DNA recombinase
MNSNPNATNPSRIVRCAIYTRSASVEHGQESLDGQEAICRAAAAEQPGLVVLDDHVYRDLGVSASTSRGRTGLDSLLTDAAKSPLPFAHLVVVDSSRLARNSSVVFDILDQLDRLGVYVHFARRQLNSADV